MRLDLLARKYFVVIVAAFVGTAAYFQALGLGSLVAASALPSAIPARGATPLPRAKGDDDLHATNADAILDRNPFDSVTGSLRGEKGAAPAADAPGEPPACGAVRALLIAASDEPAWSFASLVEGAGPSKLRRVGDDVAGSKIESIAWDRLVLANDHGRCQVKLGAPPPAAPQAAKPADEPKKPSGVAGEIAQRIHKIDDKTFTVERGAIDSALEHQAELFGRLRVVPEKDGDRTVGIKLFGIKGDSVLGLLGLQDGDRLSSINGFDLSDPQKALEAYARIHVADRLAIAIVRGGKPMQIDVKIQ